MTERGHIHPEELAARLGVSAKSVRSVLRRTFPRGEEELGNRWHLTDDEVEVVEEKLKHPRRK